MASAMASAKPAMPVVVSMPMQRISRIRPPRFLKGEPRDSQLPQPKGDIPPEHSSDVWAQGKWRNRRSNAAVDRQKVLGRQVQKALQHRVHGCNIYAYYHVKSKQVVYSLTRIMKPGLILPQLIFHGKKTVPAGLRRDSWRPYFSIHFPETDTGKFMGLRSYKWLREFAMRRQMDPDQESLQTTQEDIDRALERHGNPIERREKFTSSEYRHKLNMPQLGQKLPQQLRAEKLMNQKATSVADLSFVLDQAIPRLRSMASGGFSFGAHLAQVTGSELQHLGQKGRRKLRIRRAAELEKDKTISERQRLVEDEQLGAGQLSIGYQTARQLSVEYNGAMQGRSNRVVDMKDLPSRQEMKNNTGDDEIQVLWADIRDGMYAETWPEGVFHGELQPAALEKRAVMKTIQYADDDVDQPPISEQKQRKMMVTGSSVHVHGQQAPPNFTTFQDLIAAQNHQWNEAQESARQEKTRRQRIKEIVSVFEQQEANRDRLQSAMEAQEKSAFTDPLNLEKRIDLPEIGELEAQRQELEARLELLQQDHPADTVIAEEQLLFRSMLADLTELGRRVKSKSQVNSSSPGSSRQSKLMELETSAPARFAAARDYLDRNRSLRAIANGSGSKLTRGSDNKDAIKELMKMERSGARKQLANDELEVVEALVRGAETEAQQREGASRQEFRDRVVVEQRGGLWNSLRKMIGR